MKKSIFRCISIVLCLVLFLGVLCACSASPSGEKGAETSGLANNTSVNDDNKNEGKTLRVYDNGSHTFSIWDYDKSSETITLVFDGDKIVKSYYVFEEVNDDESVTLYNGSDSEYNWKIQISYNNIEDTYTLYFGDEENVLLYGGIDFSGDYSYKEELKVDVDENALESPLSFEVQKRDNSGTSTEPYKSRANGNWHYSVNKTDTQTLMIYEEEIFVLHYISVGQVKETVKGTYTIISDDGKYQEFKFVNADDATQVWTAKIWQTELKDDSGVSYDGIVYINSDNETMYYTGTKW